MPGTPELYLGIMSGTSLDGIDAVLAEFDKTQVDQMVKLHAVHYQPYEASLKGALFALHYPANGELHRAQLISNELAGQYAAATSALLKKTGIASSHVRAIGCHGQTIRHCPGNGYTMQLGNLSLLAELSGITVVGDFRSRDIAAGGQGAPLVPAFHDWALRHHSLHRVIVNIGGISNLTDLPPNRPATGFDCGPGNLLMDAWISQHKGEAFDKDGAWAACGRVIPELLQELLNESFLHSTPPKSTGRDLFNLEWLKGKLRGNEQPADVQATLLEFTACAISGAIQQFCANAQAIYLCGGGAHNRALVERMKVLMPTCPILLTDVLGLSADWMEAIAFAWLAKQTIEGQSASLPSVTGARHPCILGAIYQV